MPKGIDELPLAFIEKMNDIAMDAGRINRELAELDSRISNAVRLLLEETTGLAAGDACVYDGDKGTLVCWATDSRDWMMMVRAFISLTDMVLSVPGVFKPDARCNVEYVTDISKLKKA